MMLRFLTRAASLAASLCLLAGVTLAGQAATNAVAGATPSGDALHDFDFFMGHWRVHHRRLKHRLAQSQEWEQFEGESHAQALLAGLGNVDDNWLDLPSGAYRAVTIRAWDPASQSWSIWWLDGRQPNEIGTPVKGRFRQGVGEFFADEEFQGRPIRVRFLWQRGPEGLPRWEQAFSPDGGVSWETNWTMDFEPLVLKPGQTSRLAPPSSAASR